MATIKSYTSLQQSRKLAEILPIESADMKYKEYTSSLDYSSKHCDVPSIGYPRSKDIPCWSLSALLSVLPEYNLQRTDWGNKTEYKIVVTVDEDNYASKNYDNPVDVCVDMITKLHELNLL